MAVVLFFAENWIQYFTDDDATIQQFHIMGAKREKAPAESALVIHDYQISNSSGNEEIYAAEKKLKEHPLFAVPAERKRNVYSSLESIMMYIHQSPTCDAMPVFLTMANVGSDLYWQLIENFIYSMVKFNLSDCALIICVSDKRCMHLCQVFGLPCFDFQYTKHHPGNVQPSAMEQIAILKLYHIPKALKRGVDVFTLDLDAGFLGNPLTLVRQLQQSKKDIFVQRDVAFIMHRSEKLWRTWYTESLPNIGIMLVRGNINTYNVFQRAWQQYQNSDPKIRKNPGKDQNKIAAAMNYYRGKRKINWDYFQANTTVLLDKIYKWQDMNIELGGVAAEQILTRHEAVAAHATCYEQKTKMFGLKAANSFWNPRYYDPQRR